MPRKGQRIVCRHCGEVRSTYGRGLCWSCHRDHRDEYPLPERPPRVNVPGRKIVCRHCGKSRRPRGRGLCLACNTKHRDEYVVPEAELCPTARRGIGLENVAPRLPAEPTLAAPGTHWKIAVMRRRVERGESCFHPDDESRMDGVLVSELLAEPDRGVGSRKQEKGRRRAS